MTFPEIYETAHVSRLPVDPVDVSRALGVKVVDYETAVDYFDVDIRRLYRQCPLGFSFKYGNRYCIALNKNSCGERRRRFTAAHELAHCVLRHLDGNTVSCSEERAAERFAAELLAPLTVLRECDVRSAKEVSQMCGISLGASRIRVEELAERELCGFSQTEDERRITVIFGEFIETYREKR